MIQGELEWVLHHVDSMLQTRSCSHAIITEDDIADAVHKLEEDRKERVASAVEIETNSHESVTETALIDATVAKSKLLN